MIRLIRRLLSSLFLKAEAAFNLAFGDRINPFYHLGAITFFLFWVVGASGLYLYVFFETGITDAYASVVSLSTRQWWLGGIMRSVHRYASDAMALTMTLHMLRYFALERYRGLRWFSWLTGVMLIWLVYATGINGYMLPWDQLAQYVTLTVFEWLDWLPMFSGALMRNFLTNEHVGNRFFTLLSFLHIGLPLAVLMLMWVHAQRVPRARTLPPRPIAWGIVLTLLVLSILWPVHSQGGVSDLARAVTQVELDWFYMGLLPLLTQWSIPGTWLLVGAATVGLAILPWWPIRLRRAVRRVWQVTLLGDGGARVQVPVQSGETVLDAGLRDELDLAYECRNGACGLCICTVEYGQYAHRPYSSMALSNAQKARGMALMCCMLPQEDLIIEVAGFTGRLAEALVVHEARVCGLERLSHDVMRILLCLPQGQRLAYQAGQYINILLEDGQRRAFSFAGRPDAQAELELHVRLVPGGRFTTQVFERMRLGDPVRFEGPLGQFVLREGAGPLLFVAGATGFAPIKSILEEAFHQGVQRSMVLYWGVRRPADLYLLDLCEQWARDHENFRVVPVVSDAEPEDGWTGRTGLVHEAMLADFPDLAGHEVYVCGSLRMIETAKPAFLSQGLDEGACFSDAFLVSAPPVSPPDPSLS